MLTAENKQVKHGLSILKLLEAVQLPKKWQPVIVGATKRGGGGGSEVIKVNRVDATAKRVAQETVSWQQPLTSQRPDPSNYSLIYTKEMGGDPNHQGK